MRFLLWFAVGALALGGCASSDGGAVEVSRAQMGAAWPLSVDDGAVSCEGTREAGALYFERDGQKWALNGTSMTAGDAPDIAKSGLLVPNPKIVGSFLSTSPLMDAARGACVE